MDCCHSNRKNRWKVRSAYRSNSVLKQIEKKDINTYKLTRPDTDNMIKTLKDAMTKLDFWHDDAQVCHEICSKIYTDKPGIKIQILPMEAKKEE